MGTRPVLDNTRAVAMPASADSENSKLSGIIYGAIEQAFPILNAPRKIFELGELTGNLIGRVGPIDTAQFDVIGKVSIQLL